MSDHAAVFDLIPWYVNGSLNEQEMMDVTAHIERCSICSAEVGSCLETSLYAQPTGDDQHKLDTLLGARDHAYNDLVRRLSPAPVSSRPSERRPPARFGTAAVAGLAAVALAGFIIGRWVAPEPHEFEALTTTPATAPAGVVVQLIFHPELSERQIRTRLNDSPGRLLGAPSPGGVYRIVLPDDRQAGMLVQRLNTDPLILWAGIER